MLNLDPPSVAKFAVAELDDLLLVEAFGVSPPESVTKLERAALAFGKARVGRAVYLHCMGPRVKNEMPNEATRRAMLSFVRNAPVDFRCAALLLETPGISGAAFRSLFTGLFFLAKIDLPIKIHGDATAALRWLKERAPEAAVPDLARVQAERARLTAMRA